MKPTRRDFLKGSAAAATLAFTSGDIVADLIATSPTGRALESKF